MDNANKNIVRNLFGKFFNYFGLNINNYFDEWVKCYETMEDLETYNKEIESFYEEEESKLLLSDDFIIFLIELQNNVLLELERNPYDLITDEMFQRAWDTTRMLTGIDAIGEAVSKKSVIDNMINLGLIAYGEYNNLYVIRKNGKEMIRKRDRIGN